MILGYGLLSRLNNSSHGEPKKLGKIFLSFAIVGVFCLGFLGCDRSVESACGEFPRVEQELDRQRVAFTALPGVLETKGGGRKPASTVSARFQVPEAQRDAWLEWTEKLLKKTQSVRDGFEADSKRRPALKAMEEAALTLVTLHGFIEQGKMKKAVGALDVLKKNLKTAYDQGCVAKIDVKPKKAEAKIASEPSAPRENPASSRASAGLPPEKEPQRKPASATKSAKKKKAGSKKPAPKKTSKN